MEGFYPPPPRTSFQEIERLLDNTNAIGKLLTSFKINVTLLEVMYDRKKFAKQTVNEVTEGKCKGGGYGK